MRRVEQSYNEGVHAPGYQRALSRGWHFPAPKRENLASKAVPINSRPSPSHEMDSIIHRRSLFSFPAQLTDNNLALSKGPRPQHPRCLLHWGRGKQAPRASAPANGSTRTRASTNGWKSDFSLSLRKFGPCRWTFLWIDCFLRKSHRGEGAEIQGHCRAPTHRRS